MRQHPGQKVFVNPDPDWGVRVIEPGPQAAAGGGWWDDFGAIGCCVGAYQGRGAANYAASLVNLTNPGVNDLVKLGGAAAQWNAVQGWFNFAAVPPFWCLDTGFIPANGWSFLIQYANEANLQYICGTWTTLGARFGAKPDNAGIHVIYASGGNIGAACAPILLTGNLGVAGQIPYRDGAVDPCGPIPGWTAAAVDNVLIGCRNNGGPANWILADIWAISLYNCTLTAPQMAAVAAWMAAL